MNVGKSFYLECLFRDVLEVVSLEEDARRENNCQGRNRTSRPLVVATITLCLTGKMGKIDSSVSCKHNKSIKVTVELPLMFPLVITI